MANFLLGVIVGVSTAVLFGWWVIGGLS